MQIPWLFPDFSQYSFFPWPSTQFPDFSLTFAKSGISLTFPWPLDTLQDVYLVVVKHTQNGYQHPQKVGHGDGVAERDERCSDDGDTFWRIGNSVTQRGYHGDHGESHHVLADVAEAIDKKQGHDTRHLRAVQLQQCKNNGY